MFNFNPEQYKSELKSILLEIGRSKRFNDKVFRKILGKFPKDGKELFSKDQLVAGYEYLLKHQNIVANQIISTRIKMKPTRTISGVVPITVLTKPFKCPGNCIFCPLEDNLPKSYLKNEPGCQRALNNNFSPYLQVYNRLKALKNIGHNIEKAELIVLGGTWSYYPNDYQVWFVKELFRALNDFGENINQVLPESTNSIEELWEELSAEQRRNETGKIRSVGLSIETRPDFITKKEIVHIRKLGCTKVQIGIQSMNDKVLKMNQRGHTSKVNIKAADLLRIAGFKIQIHYMPNLYGSTPEIDIKGYKYLFSENSVLPDEIKLYPCSVIVGTKLFDLYKEKKYIPYSQEELIKILKESFSSTPEYTRLSRVIRDIPSNDIIAGNKITNLRELVEKQLIMENRPCQCIRCREIRKTVIKPDEIEYKEIKYFTNISTEIFMEYVTEDNKLIGFLRLSLPNDKNNFIDELNNSAIIRELHVYGESLNINETNINAAQHLGIGQKLIKKALEITKTNKFEKLSVISAIGTKEYYRKKGFVDGEIYQHYIIS